MEDSPTLCLPPRLELDLTLSDEQFWQLCRDNDDLRFERTAEGSVIIMSPTGGETSRRNADLIFQLQAWNRQYRLGEVFDSSGGFQLPNGANRSPDAAWVQRDRWHSLTREQKERFVPLCPDFVVELLSPSDSLTKTQAKLQEYINNGTRLGWLIDPQRQRVEIYRPGQAVEEMRSPQVLSGEDILPGFQLDLTTIF